MRLNPEFLRNLWLEFSLPRLVATPLVLGLVFVLLHNTQGASGVVSMGAVLFLGVTAAWGAGLASGALLREIQAGTWSSQRLTAIHPWPMTWGKLFGATAYAWYIGLWCLLAMAIAAGSLDEEVWALINYNPVLTIAFFIGIALLFHAIALQGALLQASQRRAAVRRRSLPVILGLILLGITLINLVRHIDVSASIGWWDSEWPADIFWLVSLYLFVGWAILGTTMLMRKELQVPNHPWAWLGFLAFINIYVAGFLPFGGLWFLPGLSAGTLRMALATLTTMGMCYLMVFSEATSVVDISRLMQRLRSTDRLGAIREFPRWALTMLIVWILGIGLLILYTAVDHTSPLPDDWRPSTGTRIYSLVLAGLFFLMRDLAIVLYARFADKKERATLAALAYLAILYLLPPWLLDVASLTRLQFLFLPNGYSPWFIGIVPALAQAGLAWMLVVRRWRRAAAALPVA